MIDLLEFIYGILEMGIATTDLLVKNKSVPDLNKD